MKKILLIVFALIAISSCRKEEPTLDQDIVLSTILPVFNKDCKFVLEGFIKGNTMQLNAIEEIGFVYSNEDRMPTIENESIKASTNRTPTGIDVNIELDFKPEQKTMNVRIYCLFEGEYVYGNVNRASNAIRRILISKAEMIEECNDVGYSFRIQKRMKKMSACKGSNLQFVPLREKGVSSQVILMGNSRLIALTRALIQLMRNISYTV